MLLKRYCFTTEHHFDECGVLNIKNPLFMQMADFLFGEVGEESAENLIDGGDGEQSLRLDGR